MIADTGQEGPAQPGPLAAPPEPLNGLKAILSAKAVNAVLFIDDAFDPLTAAEPLPDEAQEIWDGLVADPGVFATAQAGGLQSPDDVTADWIEATLADTGQAGARKIIEASSYAANHSAKRAALSFVIDYLRSLGVSVRTSGREGWDDQADGVKIVFLDWRLGRDGDAASINAASATARQLHGLTARPLVVLISSDPNVQQRSAEFREQSGLLTGLFDAMPKAWLNDQAGVDLQLAALSDLLQSGHVVQEFVDALRARAFDSFKLFVSAIEGLSLSDYANLQHFALKKDGHPLGEYISTLFSGLWADTLFQGPVRPHLSRLDREDFESLPNLMSPSNALADLFNSAVFDMHVGDLAAHPHAPEASDGEQSSLALSMGDVIVEKQGVHATSAYVVMNPQCDLAQSPRHGRAVPAELSILLVPGELRPIDDPDRAKRRDLADTPFFKLDEARYRIRWQPDQIMTVPYSGLPAWLGSHGRRRARMRPLYALALQHAVSGQLTRIGLPSPPPLYEQTTVHLMPTSDGKLSEPGKAYQQGRFVMSRGGELDQVVLTKSFVVEIKEAVMQGLDRLSASTNAKDKTAADELRASIGDARNWQVLTKPFAMPTSSQNFLGGAVLICHKAKKPTAPISRKLLVCVVIDLEAQQ